MNTVDFAAPFSLVSDVTSTVEEKSFQTPLNFFYLIQFVSQWKAIFLSQKVWLHHKQMEMMMLFIVNETK